MKVASFIISVIAIFLVLLSLYFSHLEPFSPSLTPGDPMWSIEAVGNAEKGLILVVPIAFLNEGVKPGCLDDIRLTLHSYQEARDTHFYPGLVIDFSAFMKGKEKQESIYQHIESTFVPILIPGKKSFTKALAFYPRHIISPENLNRGRYRIDYFYFERNKAEPKSFHSANYMIKEETIKKLKGGIAYVPLNEARDEIRGQ